MRWGLLIPVWVIISMVIINRMANAKTEWSFVSCIGMAVWLIGGAMMCTIYGISLYCKAHKVYTEKSKQTQSVNVPKEVKTCCGVDKEHSCTQGGVCRCAITKENGSSMDMFGGNYDKII